MTETVAITTEFGDPTGYRMRCDRRPQHEWNSEGEWRTGHFTPSIHRIKRANGTTQTILRYYSIWDAGNGQREGEVAREMNLIEAAETIAAWRAER